MQHISDKIVKVHKSLLKFHGYRKLCKWKINKDKGRI